MIGLPCSTDYRRPRATVATDRDAALRAAITAVRAAQPAYGYRRVTAALRQAGHVVNHKRVQRVMRELLAPPVPRRRPWVVAEPDAIRGAWYPNLRADCTPTGPDQLWVADLTYVRAGARFAYLAILLDAWSRRVIGYALGPALDARLPLAALEAALDARQPPADCIHHSDRGSQYASRRYRERLAAAGLRGSVSRAGNPYHNAHAERVMKTLKHEEVYLRGYRSMEALVQALPSYREHTYNHTRLHSALGYRTPAAFEAAHTPDPEGSNATA